MYRTSQIDRAIWRLNHPLSELDFIKQKYFADVDQDEDILDDLAERLLSSKRSLDRIHIVWSDLRLPEAFSGYWRSLEAGILCTLRHSVYLHDKGDDFASAWHSTNYLIRALQNPDWLRKPYYPYPLWLRDPKYCLSQFEQYCQRNNATWHKYETPNP